MQSGRTGHRGGIPGESGQKYYPNNQLKTGKFGCLPRAGYIPALFQMTQRPIPLKDRKPRPGGGMNVSDLYRLEERIGKLNELINATGVDMDPFYDRLNVGWIYHDCAMEGIVLPFEELTQILSGDAASSNLATAQLYQEVRNLRSVVEFVHQQAHVPKLKINTPYMKRIHMMLGEHTPFTAGEYRIEIPLHRNYFHPIATPDQIAPQMEKLSDFLCEDTNWEMHPVDLAAEAHHRFMAIFPFTEHSGRAARVISNLILMHEGFQPAIVHAADRQRYFDSLKEPVVSLKNLMIEAIFNAVEAAFQFVEKERRAAPTPAKKK
ncbi:MAG: hypothetical protein GMKNLPBB_00991 [Myxococcota bacterium]|nr:hypothetical protein [Myxococcota bacterium]